MSNGLEQVEGGPAWTLSEGLQSGLRYYWNVERTFSKLIRREQRSPAELVAFFEEQGTKAASATDLQADRLAMLKEVQEKKDEAVRYMAGLMGAY